ncbi:hypothetical protein [Streptomyces sp. NPDC020983]|uniref:hypothetical protein n=1 Tax=Streptomyces sp. NPDC020983 TaxID=3365106 RepID=UPI0037962B21
MVEIQAGGTWADITDRVYLRDRIRITRGRQDQGSRVDPGSCSLTLNNKDGRFSPRNPRSPLYGQIGRNTPVRVSAAGGTPWLGVPADPDPRARASTPDASALDITGDIDIRFDVQPVDWTSTGVFELGGKRGASGQYGWRSFLFKGLFYFEWSANGTTELAVTAPLTASALQPRLCLRATMDVDNGASGNTVRFYTGPSLSGPWTQIGTDQVSAGVTSIFANTAPLEIGDITSTVFVSAANAGGRIYAAQIRNGIGGTIVAAPDFTALTAGATSFVDSTGRAWTVTAGGITNRRIRFLGEISSWPSRWDVSGGDVYVPVQAAGIMRRLGQGASPLDSTLRRRIPSAAGLVAYWPLEDGATAGQAYSPLAGVQPMRTTGLTFAADDSLPGSSALPTVGSAASILGTVPSAASTGAWCIEFVYKLPTMPAGDANQQFLVFTTTGNTTWRIGVGASAIHVDVTASDGTSLVGFTTVNPSKFAGDWGRFYVEAQQSGSTVNFTYAWIAIGSSGLSDTGSFSGSAGVVTSIKTAFSTALAGMSIGHIAVFSTFEPTAFNGADSGFATEDAAGRYTRLCSEEGIPATLPYGAAGAAEVGPQRPGAVLDLLEEATDADVGVLYEARDTIALAYRPRVSLYNQTPQLALDYTARGLTTLEPTEDDTATRNDITISRPSGSSARATLDTGALSTLAPPLGVGRYTTSQALNVQTDDQLLDLASWLLHLGTWDEARYPQVTVNLAAGPGLISSACNVDLGDLITISNPPPWLPPDTITLMAQGYSETIGWADWTITYNCTPGGPWTVGVLDDPVLGRADTDGSQLAAGASATATSLSVAVTAGPLWVTTALLPAEFPFDIRCSGEVMTVTGITGSSSPQTFTVIRGINGITKALPSGADVRLAHPMIIAL